jgi:hypothetical protein
VAWVTRSGNTPMEKPIAIRPTSETVRGGGGYHGWRGVVGGVMAAVLHEAPRGRGYVGERVP